MSTPETVFIHQKTEGSLGEGTGLSTSNTDKLRACYPDSPIHKDSLTLTIDGVEKTLAGPEGSKNYRSLYYDVCMRGKSKSSIYGGQDMSYGTSGLDGYDGVPPNNDTKADYETEPGSPGSTISASRLGPNVSSSPLDHMADVRPNAFQPTPFASSERTIQYDGFYDGLKGISPAKNVAEEIGTINDGQSTPVEPE